MTSTLRIRLLLVVAVSAAVVGLDARPACASQPRPLPGLLLRNSTWITETGLALAPVSNAAALTTRLELGPTGMGATLGLMALESADRFPALQRAGLRHAGLEVKAVRTSGPGSPAQSLYVGPQLTAGSYTKQATLAWIFDIDSPETNHPQLSLLLGF
jgi:hypothetical protein